MDAGDALLGAIREHHVETVAMLIEDDGDLVHAEVGEDRLKLLQAAMNARSLPIVRLLVEKGADVNTADGRLRRTYCLHQAAHIGHLEILSFLLDQGADATIRPSGVTPLMHASARGHVGVVERLLVHTGGADVDLADDHGRTALSLASARGHLMVVRRLIPFTTGAAALNARSGTGGTALYFACRRGHVEVARALLLAGADPSLRNGKDESPGEAAERHHHPACMALLGWWEREKERVYMIHRARRICEGFHIPQSRDPALIAASIEVSNGQGGAHGYSRDSPALPSVELVWGERDREEGQGQEAGEEGCKEGDVAAMLDYVVKEMQPHLYTELFMGLRHG